MDRTPGKCPRTARDRTQLPRRNRGSPRRRPPRRHRPLPFPPCLRATSGARNGRRRGTPRRNGTPPRFPHPFLIADGVRHTEPIPSTAPSNSRARTRFHPTDPGESPAPPHTHQPRTARLPHHACDRQPERAPGSPSACPPPIRLRHGLHRFGSKPVDHCHCPASSESLMQPKEIPRIPSPNDPPPLRPSWRAPAVSRDSLDPPDGRKMP